MNKSEAWDDLKQWLVKAVPALYKLSEQNYTNEAESKRLSAKASGMDLVLGKMEEYEGFKIGN